MTKPITIIALTKTDQKGNPENLGDDKNAIGTARALMQQFGLEGPIETFDLKQGTEALRSRVKGLAKGDFVVIGAGERSLKPLAALKDLLNVTTSWSGHQKSSIIYDHDREIDSIHLPAYATNTGDKGLRHLITTPFGVPNDKHAIDYSAEYDKWQESSANPIRHADAYIGIMLGGDAPTAEGEIRRYTPTEAKAFGRWIGEQALKSGQNVLVTNDPRTGKYEPEDLERYNSELAYTLSMKEPPDLISKPSIQKNIHCHRADPDPVSQAFLDGLKEGGLPEERWQFFDFIPGHSALDAITGAVEKTKGSRFYMAADSASGLSELVENMKRTAEDPDKIFAYTTGSINGTHHAQIDGLFSADYIGIVLPDKNPVNILEPEQWKTDNSKPAAEILAEHLAQKVRNKKQGIAAGR